MPQMSREKLYPCAENLGKDCKFWRSNPDKMECSFPNAKMNGRQDCEGLIDDICLFLKDGRRSPNITEGEILRLKLNPPNPGH